MSNPVLPAAEPARRPTTAGVVVLCVAAAAVLAFYVACLRGMPLSLIDHGEYFVRSDRVKAAFASGSFREGLDWLLELRHPFDLPIGRVRPVFWLLVCDLCTVADRWPAAFFLSSPLLWTGCSLAAGLFARRLTGSTWLGLAALAIVALPSMAEDQWLRVDFEEQAMILFGAAAAVLAAGAPWTNRRLDRCRVPLAAALLVLFFFVKETAVNSVVPLAAAVLWFGRGDAPAARRVRAVAFAGFGVAAAFLATYLAVTGGPSGGTYSSAYQIGAGRFAASIVTMTRSFASELLWLPFLVVGSAVWRVARGLRGGGLDDATRVTAWLLVVLFSYLAILLPWGELGPRNLAAALFPLALLTALELAAWRAMAAVAGGRRRAVQVVTAATIAALVLSCTDAVLLSARDAVWLRTRYEADRDLLTEIARRAPRDACVALDIPAPKKELAFGATMHLARWYDRPDVAVVALPLGLPRPPAFVATYQFASSDAGTALRASTTPVIIGREAEEPLLSVWHVARSTAWALRHGSWPGIPRGRKRYEWQMFPAK